MNIFVGNLSFAVTDDELRKAFEAFGTVTSATVVKDKLSNKPRGFGFVEMPDTAAAQSAISALSGRQLKGRPLSVNEARPRADNRGGSGKPSGGLRLPWKNPQGPGAGRRH
ncbi:MAG TPA: RNA-binding protein [Burkholderiales bacterium]|nr:RNA-binding protein [Burkholderiales bacterium]